MPICHASCPFAGSSCLFTQVMPIYPCPCNHCNVSMQFVYGSAGTQQGLYASKPHLGNIRSLTSSFQEREKKDMPLCQDAYPLVGDACCLSWMHVLSSLL